MRVACFVAAMAFVAACGGSSSPSTNPPSQSPGSACTAAGGTCVIGARCLGAPASAQDCNTDPPTPGGGTCCLPADASRD